MSVEEEPPGESRIPVFRSGIPLPSFGAPRVRTSTQLPSRATRPTVLTGLNAHVPQPTPVLQATSSVISPTDSISGISSAHLNYEVVVAGSKRGILKYFGSIPFDTGLWCGVELHKPEGLNDGCVRGIRLFNCRPRHGILAPKGKVRLLLPPSPASVETTHHDSSQPSEVRRQRTDAYDAESLTATIDEDDGSTPRQDVESTPDDQRWLAEEVTPPAETKTEQPPPCSRAARLDESYVKEGDRKHGRLVNSASSVSIPSTQRTSDCESQKPDNHENTYVVSDSPRRRHPRSISDGSICDMAGPLSTSTPNCAETPLSTGRCTRKCHVPIGSKQDTNETCSCGLGISKQSSFELDESLCILTPDQMVDFPDCVEDYGKTPSYDATRQFTIGDPFLEDCFPVDEFAKEGEVASGDQGTVGGEGRAEEQEEREGGKEAPAEQSDVDDEVNELIMAEVKDDIEAPYGVGAPSRASAEVPSSVSSAPPPVRGAQVAPCFVASVTSITSIDPGYQGDGEWSRPASRADNSPGSSAPPGIGVNVGLSVDVLKIKFDAMTDSDFYSDTGAGGTESDADHEEVTRDGTMVQGDRRAQVIDGTLYGGSAGIHGIGGICNASHQQPQPRCFAAVMTSSTATTTEEMESSGVFSDIDRRTDLSGHGGTASGSGGGGDSSMEGCVRGFNEVLPRPSSAQGVTSSAAESSDVPQSPLEELPEDPKNDSTLVMSDLSRETSSENVKVEPSVDQAVAVDRQGDIMNPVEEPALQTSLEGAQANMPENRDLTMTRNSETLSKSCDASPLLTPTGAAAPSFPRPSSEGKKENTPEQGRTPRQKATANATPTPKKYKMPKRNVGSKIKAMIEASVNKDETGSDSGKKVRSQTPRKGRWDCIMDKIKAGQAEQRTSRPRLREVKSRVLAGIKTPPSAANAPQGEGAGNDLETSPRTKKPFTSNVTRARRAETRRSRARGLEIPSLRDTTFTNNVGVATPPGAVGGSVNHSAHSSMSDVSVSQGGVSKTSVSSRSSKKREAGRSASPFSDGSSNSGASNIPRPMPTYHGPITRQPSHTQRERTRDKPADSNALTMASSSTSTTVLRKNQRNTHLTSSTTSSAKRVNGGHRRPPQTEKSTVTEMKTPPARKPISRHLAPTGAQAQKAGSMRDNRLAPGLVNKNGSSTRGSTVVVVQRQQQQLSPPPPPPPVEPPAPENVVVISPKVPKGPPAVPPKLLQDLRHSAAGVEALGVLLQYLVFDLEAFSTPHLKKMVENFKTETINTKLQLDEAMASCRRYAEAAEVSELKHKESITELLKKHEEEREDVEKKLNSQIEETQSRYEEELKRRDRLSARDTEALLEDVKLYAERAEKAEKEKDELIAREEDLKRLKAQLEKEIADMQEKFRQELIEVSKTGNHGKLRDEIISLQAVLDLRTKEMHEYRKKAEEWWHKSEALNSAVARAAALQARVEDLEAQLQRKSSTERKLQERIRHLSESMDRECRQNEQLALENEVLEWKVNESTKLMASLSGQSDLSSSMTVSMMASSSPSSDRRSMSAMAHSLGSPESPPAFMFPRFSPRLSPKSSFSDLSGTLELEEEDDEEEEEDEEEEIEDKLNVELNQITPKVRTLVEKNESISWLVEMEEVIPAGLTAHIQNSAALRRNRRGSPTSLELLPRLPQEPSSAAPSTNSPSTSPTSSDPSSSVFCGKGILHSGRKGTLPPSKKTRLERGKSGNHLYSSTPIATPHQVHNHHRHSHNVRYHHQSRPAARLPPSTSPMGSVRSRSVSTDSESLEREVTSPLGMVKKTDHKVWQGGKSCNAWVERVPVLNVTSSVEVKWDRKEEKVNERLETDEGDGEQSVEKDDKQVTAESECNQGEGEVRISDDECRTSVSPPRTNTADPNITASKNSSSYCETGEDLSDISPYHSKGEANDCYVLTEDNSSGAELALGVPKKQPSPTPLPPSPSQATFHPSLNHEISMVSSSVMLHHSHQQHHQLYQQPHVLSSLCAHPHLAIKESAGEAMISEEISDDTQGESEDEDQREEKSLDSENEDMVGVAAVDGACRREPPDGSAVPSVLRVPTEGTENGIVEKCNGTRGDISMSSSLKLGQQVMSSSTPDSSHFAQTDSSAMDLSWSEDLELMPSESEV